MNNKKASTISPKPTMPTDIESWISGANENEAKGVIEVDVRPAGQQASQLASIEATKMLSVRIPADLHQRLRVHSVSHNKQIQDIVVSLLNRYLTDTPST
jgi:hypothetical protein